MYRITLLQHNIVERSHRCQSWDDVLGFLSEWHRYGALSNSGAVIEIVKED